MLQFSQQCIVIHHYKYDIIFRMPFLILILFTFRPHTDNKYESFIPTELVILICVTSMSVHRYINVFVYIYYIRLQTSHRMEARNHHTCRTTSQVTHVIYRHISIHICSYICFYFSGILLETRLLPQRWHNLYQSFYLY